MGRRLWRKAPRNVTHFFTAEEISAQYQSVTTLDLSVRGAGIARWRVRTRRPKRSIKSRTAPYKFLSNRNGPVDPRQKCSFPF